MNLRRDVIEVDSFIEGTETGWETVRGIGKLDKEFTKGLVKKYCGKSSSGKTFRFAYIENEKGRFWIRVKQPEASH